MDIKKGDTISFRLSDGNEDHFAKVANYEYDLITLSLDKKQHFAIKKGDSILIRYKDMDFRAEVESCSSETVKASILWSDIREYFRVDDFVQIIAKKVEDTGICTRSRIFSGCKINISDELTPDESINPVLWKMLVDIHSKLGLILERLNPDSESLLKAERRLVNISAAGICFIMDEKVEKGDVVEVKMFLPDAHQYVGIATYGSVVRASEVGCKQYKVALSFKDIEDEIKEEIIQYTLRRQREILKRQKNKGHGG